MQTVTYNAFRDNLKTGDLLLFSGKSDFSNIIKALSRGDWSHIGLVYRYKDRSGKDTLTVWESTTILGNELKDVESGKRTNGVQTVILSERIEHCLAHDYTLAFRQLNRELTEEQLTALDTLRHDFSGRPYETDVIEMLKAAWDGWMGKNHEDFSSIFCSELVAEAYHKMGVLDPETPANEYSPTDFSTKRRLKLINGYSLGEELKIAGF